MIVFVILLLYYCIGCDNKEISNLKKLDVLRHISNTFIWSKFSSETCLWFILEIKLYKPRWLKLYISMGNNLLIRPMASAVKKWEGNR